MLHEVFIGLGSNSGDRYGYIDQAILELEKDVRVSVMGVSSFIEYQAENKPDDPVFVNGVLKIMTEFSPIELLAYTEEIERVLGRTDKGSYSQRI